MVSKKMLNDALVDFNKALSLTPDDSRIYFSRGDTWMKKKSFKEAIKDYTASMELDCDNPDALYHRGLAWEMISEFKKAITDYENTIKMAPDFDSPYNSLAWILATCPDDKFRNGAKALQLAKKAVQMNRNHNTLDTLAAAYAELGDFKSAINIQRKVILLLEKEIIDSKPFRDHLKSYKLKNAWRDKL